MALGWERGVCERGWGFSVVLGFKHQVRLAPEIFRDNRGIGFASGFGDFMTEI